MRYPQVLIVCAMLVAGVGQTAWAKNHRSPPPPAERDNTKSDRWQPQDEPGLLEAELDPNLEIDMPAHVKRSPTQASMQADARLQNGLFLMVAVTVVGGGFAWSLKTGRRRQRENQERKSKAREEGLDLPASLHPVIDPDRCIGCGSCVAACPDKSVLGVIDNHAHVLTASNCVGHGLCKAVCPVDAITLVFGTEDRPVDLPKLDSRYETSVPGLYVAGALGGMGLIANAFDQAILAVDSIAEDLRGKPQHGALDLLVIGAGPAGLGASLRAQDLGLRYTCIDQAPSWGGAIRAYPRKKLVMTRSLRVPVYGPVRLGETNKESLVDLWSKIIEQTQVKIQYSTRVEKIEQTEKQFIVSTSQGPIEAKRVLLAIGDRGTPRKLGVPGDSGPNVVYTMLEPEKWAGQAVVVIGGGDVACETALALSEQPNTTVWLAYRGKALTRPKAGNRTRVAQAVETQRLRLLLETSPTEIRPDRVIVKTAGGELRAIKASTVFSCLGGEAPTRFLRECGIEVVTLRGEAMA